jgi:hypothetical protein
MLISLLVPTWGRPERLLEMVESAKATASDRANVEIVVRVSSNDAHHRDYPAIYYRVDDCDSYGQGIEFLRRHAHGDILFAGADDVVFTTPGWDDKVREAFAAVPDKLLVAYSNNGQGRRKCEHFFTTRKWIDTVGYMVWPEFRHFCVDQWVEELASAVGRLQFLEDVVTDHRHKKYGKAPNDATYELVRGVTRTSEADNALYAQRGRERQEAVVKLRAAMELAAP